MKYFRRKKRSWNFSPPLTRHAVSIGGRRHVDGVHVTGQSGHFQQLEDLARAQFRVVLEEHDAVLDGQIRRRSTEVPRVLQVVVVEHEQRVPTHCMRTDIRLIKRQFETTQGHYWFKRIYSCLLTSSWWLQSNCQLFWSRHLVKPFALPQRLMKNS